MKNRTPYLAALLLVAAACASAPAPVPGLVGSGPPAVSAARFRAVDAGVAISGKPSDDALREAAAQGYRTVVDLRMDEESKDPGEEGKLVASLGMRYVRVPVARGSLEAEQADSLAAAIAPEGSEPVLIHCASGQRAGALWGLYLAKHRGRTPEEALAVADAVGTGRDMRSALERCLRER